MRICWVTNERYYSRLLRYIFNDETSHVGVIFDFDDIRLATDLNKPYGKVWDAEHWLHKYNIVWSMDVDLSHEDEIAMYKLCRDYCALRKYDMSAYYYGMLMGLRLRFLRLPLPSINKWSNNTGSTCQEVLTPLVQSDILRHVEPRLANLDSKRFSACTPDMTITVMKKATKDNPRIRWIFNG